MAKETNLKLFLGEDQPSCQWCGEKHGAERLCERAQRGMTRRSFCFLFGAGVGALALGVGPSLTEPAFEVVELDFVKSSRLVMVSEELLQDAGVNIEEFFAHRFGHDWLGHTVCGYWDDGELESANG